MTASDPPADAARIGAFFDADTRRKGHGADVLLGTVTEDAAVVRHRDRLEKAHLDRVLPPRTGLRLLDLGGGAGRITFWLADRAADAVQEAVLVDASAELLAAADAEARRRGLALTTVHGAVTEPLPPALIGGGFDLIVLFAVAGYLDDAAFDVLVDRVADALAPGGLVVFKESVCTDGALRFDTRREGEAEVYRFAYRPRGWYARRFARRLRLTYRKPTCAHFFPWFLGGTDGAVQAANQAADGRWLDTLGPLLTRVDPLLQAAEDAVRGDPRLARLLAPVPVVQDLCLFSAGEAVATAEAAAGPPDLTVVVIAYDEEDCIEPVIDELRAALDGQPDLGWELVCVDDGSADGTPAILDRLAGLDPRVRVVHQPNRGIGGALRTGFDSARGTSVTWVPADGQIAPASVLELYRRRHEAPMLTTVYRTRDDHWMRTVISRTLNTMIRVKTGEVAKSGGNYLFARAAWLEHGPRDDDSMMISTAFRHNLRAAGLPPVEVEIDCRARVGGRSKVLNPRTILRTVGQLLKMR